MSSMNAPQNAQASNRAQNAYQEQLINYCRSSGMRPPTWQVLSDRRGGRTAWSCTVNIQGQPIQARFWYDGQYVNSAREDAAQMALQRLGQLQGAAVPQSPPTQQTVQQAPQGQTNQQAGQPQYYGVIGK